MSDENEKLGPLLDSYAQVLRAQVDMDFTETCDRDRKNLQTLLVDRPDIGHRTIVYLIDALQDAAEKRMSAKYSYRIDPPVAAFHTITEDYEFRDAQLVPVVEEAAEPNVISLEEARRRAAVANMLIVECEAADALKDAFKESLTPDKTGPRADPRPVWHSRHGWMTHPLNQVQTLAESVESGDITRAQAAEMMGRDIDEVDAENARDRTRQLLNSVSFADFVDEAYSEVDHEL